MLTVQSPPAIVGKTAFINTLPAAAMECHSFGATLVHRVTGQEVTVDLLVDSDRFVEVTRAIRQSYPSSAWAIFETWPID